MIRSILALSVTLLMLAASPTSAHVMLQKDLCQNTDWEKLQQSVVSITFMFDEPDENGYVGKRGTAWFLSPTKLVTVGHVIDGVLEDDWLAVTISYGHEVREPASEHIVLRVRHIDTIEVGLSENIVVLEMDREIDGFVAAEVRASPVQKNEAVVAVGYRGGEATLQRAVGHFGVPESSAEPDPDAKPLEPFLYFEMSNELGKDRKVLDSGTSGSPLFDCEGQVVAVAHQILTQSEELNKAMGNVLKSMEQFNRTMPGGPLDSQIQQMRNGIATSWGNPTNSAVPASPLLSKK